MRVRVKVRREGEESYLEGDAHTKGVKLEILHKHFGRGATCAQTIHI